MDLIPQKMVVAIVINYGVTINTTTVTIDYVIIK